MITPENNPSALSNEERFKRLLKRRQFWGNVWSKLFLFSIIVGILALLLLFYNITRQAVTLVVVENTIDPNTLVEGKSFEELNKEELIGLLSSEELGLDWKFLRMQILEEIVGLDRTKDADKDELRRLNRLPISESLPEGIYQEAWADIPMGKLNEEQAAYILGEGLSREALQRTVIDEIVDPEIVASWTLTEALFNRDEIDRLIEERYATGDVQWKFWLSPEFLTTPMHSRPELAGLRTAILGSLWMMIITVSFAFPVGIGAAIYLEEYAADNWLNRIIQVNINNLAGVPSIIYGILGLVVFVRAMEILTSGKLFGIVESEATVSGRTVLSAGLTLGLLILPIIIINAQEAIRAVPPSQREASYGMGATRLQMISSVVLPSALPGILTGTILAISRAFGETAPLVVVGSITRITVDPSGPFSRFTAIPIQIYTWTAEPADEFRSIAAAGIIVLLVILLMFNSIAIILRNRLSKTW